MCADTRYGLYLRALLRIGEIAEKFDNILGKVVSRLQIAAQCSGGRHVCSRRTAQAQINAIGKERGQGSELFRNHQWCVVRQHHATGTNPHGFRNARHVPDQHGCGGAGNATHIVMFCEPVAVIATGLRMLGQFGHVAQGGLCGAALWNGGEVKE